MSTDASVPAQKRPAALGFIFVTILLDVISFGMVIPVLPMLILQFEGGDTARAAALAGLFGTVWAAMQFFCSPIQGALSDRFGRRPVLLLSMAGLGLDKVLMALAPNLGVLFLGRLLSGATAASFSTAAAYIADISNPEDRARNFSYMNAAFGAGFVLGPALGGFLGGIDPRLPFWAAAGMCGLNALWGYFVLPESLPKERRSVFAWTRANPLGSLKLLATSAALLGLAGVHTLFQLAHNAMPSIFVLYSHYRYGWDAQMAGLTLGFVGALGILMSLLVVPRAVKALGERRTLLLGLAFGAAAMTIYAWAPNGPAFFVGIVVAAFMGLYGPAAQSLMVEHVPRDSQGQLQGALAAIMGLTGMIGPTLFTLSLSAGIAEGGPLPHLPGLPLYIAAALLAAAAALAWRVTRGRS